MVSVLRVVFMLMLQCPFIYIFTKQLFFSFHACNVGDEGAVSLSQLINQVTTIASLDLVRCRVKCAGVAALGVSLMQNSTLKALKYVSNRMILKIQIYRKEIRRNLIKNVIELS